MQTFLNSNEFKLVHIILGPAVIIFATEILVDWLKHSFIIKFNGISPRVYQRYKDSICRALLGIKLKDGKGKGKLHTRMKTQEKTPEPDAESSSQSSSSSNSETTSPNTSTQNLFASTKPKTRLKPVSRVNKVKERSPIVARRMGFISIPLACLVVRITTQLLLIIGIMPTTLAEEQWDSKSTEDEIGSWKLPLALIKWIKASRLKNTNHPVVGSNWWFLGLYLS